MICLNCVSLSCSAVDFTNALVVNTTDGFKYTQFLTGFDTTSIQSNNTLGSVIPYKTNNITVNNNGVSCSPLSITSPSTTAKPLTVIHNAGSTTFYVNNNGFVSCASISSSDSISAVNNIEAVGNMSCRVISTNGANGISIYNGATLNASMNQVGTVTGTTLTITSPSTTDTPLLVQSFALQNIFTVDNYGNFTNTGDHDKYTHSFPSVGQW